MVVPPSPGPLIIRGVRSRLGAAPISELWWEHLPGATRVLPRVLVERAWRSRSTEATTGSPLKPGPDAGPGRE